MSVSKMTEIDCKLIPVPDFIVKLRKTHCDDAFKKEIYGMFNQFILRSDLAEMWGFPFLDKGGSVKYLSNRFTKSPMSQVERCRCGKQINLNEEDWHIDKNGCNFHPGKLFYTEKQNAELYSCCQKKFPESGCVRRTHHVSSTRAYWGDAFAKTGAKRSSFLPALPNIFALDCEMVYTTVGMEVVKVTVLSVFCDVVYDTFVKPNHPVIDYNTDFSGIDASHLASVTVDLKQVQSVLLQLFDRNTILVGHGLENDLLCLSLFHQKLIDTSIIFSHEKGFPYRHSLKHLAKIYLSKDIHCSSRGHDSKEDAKTCLELIAREIFLNKTKKTKMVNACLSKILQWQKSNNAYPTVYKKSSGIPTYGYQPTVYMNYTWTTAYPGYCVTQSVLYPCGILGYNPPPPIPLFPTSLACDKIGVPLSAAARK